MRKAVIVSDLDGTLFDAETYSSMDRSVLVRRGSGTREILKKASHEDMHWSLMHDRPTNVPLVWAVLPGEAFLRNAAICKVLNPAIERRILLDISNCNH